MCVQIVFFYDDHVSLRCRLRRQNFGGLGRSLRHNDTGEDCSQSEAPKYQSKMTRLRGERVSKTLHYCHVFLIRSQQMNFVYLSNKLFRRHHCALLSS